MVEIVHYRNRDESSCFYLDSVKKITGFLLFFKWQISNNCLRWSYNCCSRFKSHLISIMNSPKPQKSSKKVKNHKSWKEKKCPEELRQNFHRAVSLSLPRIKLLTVHAREWTADALHVGWSPSPFSQAENFKLTNHRAPSYNNDFAKRICLLL